MDGPDHARPVRARRELVRTEVDDRRIVQRPLDRIARPRHDLRSTGALPLLGYGRLAAGEHEASRRILGDDRSLEHREQRPVVFHADEELRAAHTGHGERRLTSRLRGPRLKKLVAPRSSLTTPVRLVLRRLRR